MNDIRPKLMANQYAIKRVRDYTISQYYFMRQSQLNHMYNVAQMHVYLLEFHYKMKYELKGANSCRRAQEVIDRYTDQMVTKINQMMKGSKMHIALMAK